MIKKYVLLFVLQLSAACAEGAHQPIQSDAAKSDAGQPTFLTDILPVIQARCAMCHNPSSGLPDWQNYEVLFAKKDLVRKRVFETQDMPRGNATGMTLDERELLALWVDIGAPLE